MIRPRGRLSHAIGGRFEARLVRDSRPARSRGHGRGLPRARDPELGREVAIKVLPAEVARDPERLSRFQREATLLAALNHPNIASIHGLEDSDSGPFLVLELVEGEDLAERLKRGPIPVEEALEIARQVTGALEEAHEKGIVHRDLKPANVKLTPDGKVKVLDFGLAKAWEGEAGVGSSSDLSQSPTLARSGTLAGVILGTAAYMSPEQAKGKRVDRRTDIWAFGALLYEMLRGRRAFVGEDVSDTLAAVLRAEPDLAQLPRETPPALVRVLRLCLTKDPKRRVRDIGDVRLAMDGAFETAAEATQPISVSRRRLPWAAALLAALAVALVGWSLMRRAPAEPRQITRFTHELPVGTELRAQGRSVLAVSPDGPVSSSIRRRGCTCGRWTSSKDACCREPRSSSRRRSSHRTGDRSRSNGMASSSAWT